MDEPYPELRNQIDQNDGDPVSFYWDWNKHEDDVFTNRGSFFLVGQSMLIAAASALMAAGLERLNVAIFLLASTGLLLTVVHLLVSLRHLRTQRLIRDQLRTHQPLWTSVYDRRPPFLRAAQLMGIAVPTIVLFCWAGLLLLAVASWTG